VAVLEQKLQAPEQLAGAAVAVVHTLKFILLFLRLERRKQ
jgi:hypothetical protein